MSASNAPTKRSQPGVNLHHPTFLKTRCTEKWRDLGSSTLTRRGTLSLLRNHSVDSYTFNQRHACQTFLASYEWHPMTLRAISARPWPWASR